GQLHDDVELAFQRPVRLGGQEKVMAQFADRVQRAQFALGVVVTEVAGNDLDRDREAPADALGAPDFAEAAAAEPWEQPVAAPERQEHIGHGGPPKEPAYPQPTASAPARRRWVPEDQEGESTIIAAAAKLWQGARCGTGPPSGQHLVRQDTSVPACAARLVA